MSVFEEIKFNVKLDKLTFCQYKLVIDHKIIRLTFPQLLQLRTKVNELTTQQNLEKLVNNENFVLLFIADKKHLLFLEVPKLLDLKDELNFCFSDF